MQSEDELKRDQNVIWIRSTPTRLYYFRPNRGLKDFHVWDTTMGTEIETRPGQSIEDSELPQWFEEFLQGRR